MTVDIPDLRRVVSGIKSKMFLLLGRAILTAINNSESTQKLQVTLLAGETATDMERFQNYGFESFPLAGAEVAVMFLGGNREAGIALVVHDRRYRPTDLASGEVAIYTSEGCRLTLKAGKIAQLDCQDFVVNAAGAVNINAPAINQTGSVTVTGPLTQVGGGANAFSGPVAIEGIDFGDHVHGGVQPGAGVTGVPQ